MGAVGFINNQLRINGNAFNDSQPFRNRIINGDMAINQINGSTAITPTVTAYISDQYLLNISQASKLTVQQVVDAPIGFKFSTKITVATQYAPLATDYFQYLQAIEGQMITDFALGTSGAVTLNTSNWIKGSVAGTYAVSIRNSTPRISYVGTINVTTSWSKVSITLIGDTTGTWNTDTTAGMYWAIDLGSGANFTTTAGSWQVGDFVRTAGSVTFVNQVVGSTLNITGVQLEKVPTGATQGTDFEFLPADVSMGRCQRYYEKGLLRIVQSAAGIHNVGGFFEFKVNKRLSPSILIFNILENANIGAIAVNPDITGFRAYGAAVGAGAVVYTAEYSANARL